MIGKSSPFHLEANMFYQESEEIVVVEIFALSKTNFVSSSRKKKLLDLTLKDASEKNFSLVVNQMKIRELGGTMELWEGRGGLSGTMKLPLPIDDSSHKPPLLREANEELKVLFVEDNIICRKFASRYIQKFSKEENVKIILRQCENGKEAFEVMKDYSFNPDVIITDYDMPIWNGERLAYEILREEPKRQNWCDIYLLTGASFPENKIKVFEERKYFKDILSKPIRFDMIKTILENTIRRKRLDVIQQQRIHPNKEEEEEEEGEEEEEEEEEIKKNNQKKRKGLRERVFIFMCFLISLSVCHYFGLNIQSCVNVVFIYALAMCSCEILTKTMLKNEKSKLVASNFLRRVSLCFFVSMSVRRGLQVGIIDIMKLKQFRTSASLFCLFFIFLFEVYFLYFGYLRKTVFDQVSDAIIVGVNIIMIIFTFRTISEVTKRYKQIEIQKQKTFEEYIKREKQFESIIEYSSDFVRKPFFALEHFSKCLYQEFFKQNQTIPSEIDSSFVYLFQSLSKFRKDCMNLLLVNGLQFEVMKSKKVNSSLIIPLEKVLKEIISEEVQYYHIRSNGLIINVEFNEEFDRKKPFVMIDPYILEVIISNLIQNSLQSTENLDQNEFGEHEIRILVDVNEMPETTRLELVFTIYDSGKGMRKEELLKYSCCSEDNDSQGFEILSERSIKEGEETGNPRLGIGLLCCKKLISDCLNRQYEDGYSHNATLSIFSDGPNTGCKVVFRCELPLSIHSTISKGYFDTFLNQKKRKKKNHFMKNRKNKKNNRSLHHHVISSIKRKDIVSKMLDRRFSTINPSKKEKNSDLSFLLFYKTRMSGRATKEILINLGCRSSKIHSVMKNEKRFERKYDIFLFEGESSEFHEVFEHVEEEFNGLCVFITKNFGEQGLIKNRRSIDDDLDIFSLPPKGSLSILCLDPLRKFDCERILDFYFVVNKNIELKIK